jgi:hypothetical protein
MGHPSFSVDVFCIGEEMWATRQRCLRTAQDNYVLDRAFSLIEGHPPGKPLWIERKVGPKQ